MAQTVVRPARAHLLSLVAVVAVVAVTCVLWLAWYRTFPRGTGFDDLSGIAVPFAILGATILWLLVRAIAHGRIEWRVVTVFVVSFAFALAPVIVYCGPVACFAPGPQRLLGWFVLGGVVVAALAHHIVLNALTPRNAS